MRRKQEKQMMNRDEKSKLMEIEEWDRKKRNNCIEMNNSWKRRKID